MKFFVDSGYRRAPVVSDLGSKKLVRMVLRAGTARYLVRKRIV